jgi:hypothetical protein
MLDIAAFVEEEEEVRLAETREGLLSPARPRAKMPRNEEEQAPRCGRFRSPQLFVSEQTWHS